MPNTEIVKVGSDEIEAVRDDKGKGWVLLKRMCEVLGLSHDAQRRRLMKQEWADTTMMVATAADGKNYENFVISTESTPMWLATVQASRVTPKAKAKLIQFQKLAAKALADWAYGRNTQGGSFQLDRLNDTLDKLNVAMATLTTHVMDLKVGGTVRALPAGSEGEVGTDEEVGLVDLAPSVVRKMLNRMVRQSVDYGFEVEYRAAWDKLYRLYSRNSGINVVHEAFEAGVLRGKEVIPLDWIAKYGHLYHLYRYAKTILKPGKPRELRKGRDQSKLEADLASMTDFESIWDN